MSNRPRLWLIAGPNGAGKSTLTERFGGTKYPIVNPDTILENQPDLGLIGAGREALRQQETYLENRQGFVWETTFTGKNPQRVMEAAKRNGFEVNFVFIGLDAPGKSAVRVAGRVAAGGHAVPQKDIIRRFSRSMDNLPLGLIVADRSWVLDNSGKKPLLIARFERGKRLWLSKGIPTWTERTSLRRFFAKAPANSRKKEQDLER